MREEIDDFMTDCGYNLKVDYIDTYRKADFNHFVETQKLSLLEGEEIDEDDLRDEFIENHYDEFMEHVHTSYDEQKEEIREQSSLWRR